MRPSDAYMRQQSNHHWFIKWLVAWSVPNDDVIKRKHFPRYWPFMRLIHQSPLKRPATRSFDIFFDLRPKKRIQFKWSILSHWDRVRHICVSNLTIIGSYIGLLPGRCQMMTSSNGNIFRVTGYLCGEFTSPRWKGQRRGALMVSLIFARINDWVNNGEAGDLRRHRAHYDVIVLLPPLWQEKERGINVVIAFTGDNWDCRIRNPIY